MGMHIVSYVGSIRNNLVYSMLYVDVYVLKFSQN